MDITGKLFISKGNYGFYATLKDKQNDAKFFLPVSFRRDAEPQDGGEINIKNGFLTAYPTKDGGGKPKLMVMEYEYIAGFAEAKKPTSGKLVDISAEDDPDLPF